MEPSGGPLPHMMSSHLAAKPCTPARAAAGLVFEFDVKEKTLAMLSTQVSKAGKTGLHLPVTPAHPFV